MGFPQKEVGTGRPEYSGSLLCLKKDPPLAEKPYAVRFQTIKSFLSLYNLINSATMSTLFLFIHSTTFGDEPKIFKAYTKNILDIM
jgi:hypothetical protein